MDFNIGKAARSPDFMTRERAKFERKQIAKDCALENSLVTEARRRTLEARRHRAEVTQARKEAKNMEKQEVEESKRFYQQKWSERRQALKARHDFERASLLKQQDRFSMKFLRVVDITGWTRKAQDEARKDLQAKHREERRALARDALQEREALQEAIKGRYEAIKHEIDINTRKQSAFMRERHELADKESDQLRQQRATEREQETQQFEETIRRLEQARKAREKNKGPGLER